MPRVSDVTIAKWRDTFLAAAAEALAAGSRPRESTREAELEAERVAHFPRAREPRVPR